MKKSLLFALFFCSFMGVPSLLFGQIVIPNDSVGLFVVKTLDDNEFIGAIISQDPLSIVLRTENLGDLTIQKRRIRSIVPVEKGQIVNGEYWFENPHSTRYFFNSNGYSLRKGEGYYQNTWIFFNQVSYGVTDNFTIGAGIVPTFLFGASLAETPLWLTPKLSFPIKRDMINIGTGAFLGTLDGEVFGLVYGNSTFGPRDRNISIGLGYGFVGGEWSSTPAISLSGMARVSKKFAFMTENYIIDTGGQTTVISLLGGRFIGRKIAIDAALVLPISELDQGFFALPWLGISVPFGKRR